MTSSEEELSWNDLKTLTAEVIGDEAWLKDTFVPTVGKRGAAIIEARGASSAASAANAVVDTVVSLTTPTPAGDWNSVAVCSNGEYDTPAGLISSFPIRTDGENWSIVQDVALNDYSTEKIAFSLNELAEEKSTVDSSS